MRERRGFVALGSVLLALGIACSLVAMWASSSSQALSDVARLRDAQECMELARSAVAECWFNAQRTANDPEAPLAALLRKPDPAAGRALPLPELVHARDLPGGQDAAFDARLKLAAWRRTAPWPGDAAGELTLTVTVRSGRGSTRTLIETRAFRVQRTSLPPPLDRWALAPAASSALSLFGASATDGTLVAAPADVLSGSAEGTAAQEFLATPAGWRGLAAYHIDGAAPGALAAWLARRMERSGRVNGIVYCDGGAQKLRKLTLRGRMLLVVAGPVALDDVVTESPAEDTVAVVAYGPLALAGKVHASLLRALPADAAGTEIELSEGRADVTGALIDLCGVETQEIAGSLAANPHALARAGAADPAALVVLISPLTRTAAPGRS